MHSDLAAAHAIITRFCVSLVTRPDRDEVRAQLAAAFVEHVGDLWPAGRDEASPEWIAANVDEVLATIERLYATATDDERPSAGKSRPHGLATGAAATARSAGATRRVGWMTSNWTRACEDIERVDWYRRFG